MTMNDGDNAGKKSRSRKRRGRGEGAVYQRADGRWTAVLSLGYGTDGKRRRRVIYGASKAEVQEKLRKLQAQSDSGSLPEAGTMTVAQLLAHWHQDIHKLKVQPGTSNRNEVMERVHLTPRLGKIKLSKLTEMHVQRFIAEMMDAGESKSSARRCVRLLRTVMKHAVKKKLIAFDPTADVVMPLVDKKEMSVLDAGQAARFLKAAEADRLHAMYALALDTGMRQGELFGLQWADFDFAGGSVQVQRSLEERKGYLRLKEPKTEKARRRIDLSGFAVAVMLEHRKR